MLDYCRRSANPVGRLVLLLHSIRDEERHLLSDRICTGLQLANFWQDVGVDLEKDRIYLRRTTGPAYGVTEEALFARRRNRPTANCCKFQVDRTWEIFHQGRPLTRKIARAAPARKSASPGWAGRRSSASSRRRTNDTLTRRPKLGKADMALLFF